MKFPNPFEPFTLQEAEQQGNDLGNEGAKRGAKFTKEYAKNVGNKIVGGVNVAADKIMNVVPTSGYMVLFFIIFWWFIFQSFLYFSNNPATTDSFTFFSTLIVFIGVYNVIAYYFYTKEISIRALINTGILSVSMGGPVALLLSFSNSFVNVFGNSIGYYFNSVAASEVMNKNFTSKCFPNAQIDFGPLVNIFQVNSSNDFYQKFFKDANEDPTNQFDIKLNADVNTPKLTNEIKDIVNSKYMIGHFVWTFFTSLAIIFTNFYELI
jgi:hypothetical protein